MSEQPWEKLRLHWPFAVLALIGLTLILFGLGKDDLWADEGDTAVFAKNIVQYGVPKAWDGIAFIDSDKGARLNNNLVMVTSPWLQYYATAASFFLFGKSTFSARLPFAIAGWLTALSAYLLVLQTSASRSAALSATSILFGSIQFLLYCRQCRYYALSMLLMLLLLSIFLRMKSARHCALFALTAVLLFYAHPISAVPLIAFGILTIVYRPFSMQRRWFWIAAPAILALTLPWVFVGGGGYAESMASVQSVPQFIGRFVQYLIECASVTPLVGIAVIALLCGFRAYRNKYSSATVRSPAEPGAALIILTFVALFLYALTIAAAQPADSLWRIGIRYTTPMIPLIAISAGVLIARICRGRTVPILVLTAIIIFTKFAQLTPWIFWGKSVASLDGKEVIEAHLPNNLAERFLNTRQQWFFLSDLFQSNPGTVANVSDFLREHAEPADKLITNYEWEPLYFHTGLAQALKILPDYPIYPAAKANGLPDYVFDVDQVRWVIWRPAWDGYEEYFAGAVQQQIANRGGKIERVAEVTETLWENRENIHFRRFSGGRYLFHGPETFPPVSIFRVSWPGTY